MKKKLKIFLWPLIFKFRKWIYPFKIRIYEYRIYKSYSQNRTPIIRDWFVLMFDDKFSQSGLVDRLKGIVTAYYLAKELKINLSIYFSCSSDPLINIINLSSVNLLTSSNALSFSKRGTYPVVWYNYIPRNGFNNLKKIIKKKQIHFYSNMDLLPIVYKSENDFQTEWSKNFKELFIQKFEFQFNTFTTIKYQRVIGIHLRFIGLLGDFRDIRLNQISLEYSKNMMEWCLSKIIHISNIHSDSKLLIVSDSVLFLKYLNIELKDTGLFQKIIIDIENIAHTAIVHNQNIFDKAYSDFLSLSRCDKVYQLRYGKMHKSDFSKYASVLGKNKFILVDNSF